jgi:soluble lytic murein transglycosylase-like protein
MLRWMAPLALAATMAAPAPCPGQDIYSFVDRDGVLHVTNVPQDSRYRRRGYISSTRSGLHRIVVRGRSGRSSSASALPLLARSASYDDHIRNAAERHGLPVPLLKAVMAVESNFNPRAVSEKGASGLMQLMPAPARDMAVDDIFDPAQNIDGGARYLRYLHDQFGSDLEKVLAAYNAGPEAVRRSGGAIPRIPETQAYVRKVMALYDTYLRGS